MILILTSISFSSARFEGSLNMDLNEIAMNLVPFPRLHYLVSSLTPLYMLADVNVPTRRYLLKKKHIYTMPQTYCISEGAVHIPQVMK